MGRAPCCDKANVKKGPWSPEEDAKLKSYIEQHGTGGNWIALPQKIGLKRCGKSCRLRWLNYLRPNIKHGSFSEEEDNIICSLYVSIGSRWSVIAAQLPGRTDNDIKNYWNTRLKKKLLGKHRKEQHQQQQARSNNNRGNINGVVKQGISNHIGDSSSSLLMVDPENSTQQPYWPLLPPPVPYTTNQLEGPSFNDQDSIRKLLIKLGGRFSDHDCQPTLDGVVLNNLDHQFPIVPPSTQEAYEEQQVHTGSSSCTNSINNNAVQFSQISNNNQYCSDEVQGQGNFTAAIGDMEHGIEFFYGEDMVVTDNKIIGTTTTTTCCSQGTTNWDDTSTTIYPPPSFVTSNYRQETPHECLFQQYYPGPQ